MPPRTTIKDIARVVGVHHATVSRALRDDPKVAASTIARVKAAAQELGYAPDPMMRALALYRSSLRPVNFKETLGLLWPEQTPDEVAASPYLQHYLRGARARAAELGYHIDEFYLSAHRPAALVRILQARGIRGLVIGLITHVSAAHLRLPFEKFALAAITSALKHPRLHRFGHDHFGGMCTALHHLRGLGYRRIGYLGCELQERLVEKKYSASFLAHHPLGPSKARGLLDTVASPGKKEIADFAAKTRPEVVLVPFSPTASTSPIPDGPRIPIVSLNLLPSLDRNAGIDQLTGVVAASAVDTVVEQLLHGRWGIPGHRKNVLTDGEWVEHPSCPPCKNT